MNLGIIVRNTEPGDFASIVELTEKVYASATPWTLQQLQSHVDVFPEGQFVAVLPSGLVVGMAASLIIHWDDYEFDATWRDFTDRGMFTNHDPIHGRTLYGAEVMVHPDYQKCGVGTMLYKARRSLAERLGLRRIRAAARLRGYHRFAQVMSPQDYVAQVSRGEIKDPTLSFQIKNGFQVLGVVSGYLRHDPESLGYAAVIEWRNLLVESSAASGCP
jgi:GNAT superfamily N-acetyltransferase